MAPSSPTLARVHALLGVLLGVYLVVHLWENWPALEDRELWVDRMRASGGQPWTLAIVLLPLSLHAVLGAVRWRRQPGGDQLPAAGGAALRRVQAISGVLLLGFVVYHVVQVVDFQRGPHFSYYQPYGILSERLGQPLHMVLYVVGIGLSCLHLSHGLPRAALTLGLRLDDAAFRRARFLSVILGLVLWVLYLQIAAHFAIGEGLIPTSRDGEAETSAHNDRKIEPLARRD